VSIETVRVALHAALTAIDGLRAQQEWETAPNVSGEAAVAVITFDGATYDTVMGGAPAAGAHGDDLTFDVIVCVPKTQAGRKRLDALVDPDPDSTTSLRVNLSPTLGGAVSVAEVRTASGYREYGPESQPMLGCAFAVGIAT
jgi:hypothetical protein